MLVLLLLGMVWEPSPVATTYSPPAQQWNLPDWVSARKTPKATKKTMTNGCEYSCSGLGVCMVEYRGYPLGQCSAGGECVGTPQECQPCNQVVHCENFVNYGVDSGAPKHADYKAVILDLKTLMTESQEFWPADFGHYGPLLIRLAWHTAGSYRTSDGRGGADGARIRFNPEASWPDNTNLDKARTLLWPIKQKYGSALSWGDLIILAGNTAIESMGGPILGFCGGRVDARDGSESIVLGPSSQQEKLMPCKIAGRCESPLGTSTIGLIYVNPEGPNGVPNPYRSAEDIAGVFSRMGMNRSETVALIGGGHTTGKSHGPCPAGAGPGPLENPENPWPGKCGSGKGKDVFTSGFELTWTTKPTTWDNEYFRYVLDLDWRVRKGPGHHHQWEPHGQKPQAPSAFGRGNETIGMLTSDIALKVDSSYRKIVKSFKDDLDTFNHAFKHAWYKLTTGDMGPRSRCINEDAPPAQPFQNPLPDPPAHLPNYQDVKKRIIEVTERNADALGKLTRLAWQCISSFRATDYLGGCNGARLRFPPQKNWPGFANLDQALRYLQPVKTQFASLSWADLIVLAGNTAMELAGSKMLTFCGGRTDAPDGRGSQFLFPKISGHADESVEELKYYISLMGVSKREFAALNGIGYAIGDTADCDGLFCRRNSFYGSKSVSQGLSNIFFLDLLSNSWQDVSVAETGKKMYKAKGKKELLMLRTDFIFSFDPELLAIAQEFAADNQMFLREAATAWTKLANADRFAGPSGNICTV